MTIAGYLPLIVCLLGLAVFWGCSALKPEKAKPALAESGRIAFAMGLLAFLLTAGAVMSSCSTASGGHVSTTPVARGER